MAKKKSEKDLEKNIAKSVPVETPEELEEINKVLDELDLDTEYGGPSSVVSVTPEPEAPPVPEQPSVPEPEAPPVPEQPSVPEPEVPPVPEQPSVPEPPATTEEPVSQEASISDELSFLDELGKSQDGEVPSEGPVIPTDISEAPPVEAPPVEASPVETPPVEAPPVEAPPVEAPPVEAPPEPASADEKKDGIDLSDEQVIELHKKISLLKPELRKVVKDIIVNETLPKDGLRVLFDHLLSGTDEETIQGFVEQELNIKIQEKKVPAKPFPKIQKRLKPSFINVIKHDFIPILRLAIPVIAIIFLIVTLLIRPIVKKNKAKSLIEEGVQLIKTDKVANFIEAEDKFNSALKIKKDYIEAYLQYGDAYLDVNKYDKSKNKYLEYQKIDEDDIISFFKIGDLYDKQTLYDNAIEEYKKVLELDKNNVKALDKIAQIYYDKNKKNDKEKSLKIYREIVKNEKDNIQAHYGLLSIYIQNKDLDNIEREHYQVLSLGKDYKDLKRLTSLAEFYIDYDPGNPAKKEDLYNKAEDTLKRIFKIDNRYSEAYYQYARLFRSRRDLRNSSIAIKSALKFKQSDAKYYNFLGEVYLMEGKVNLAIEEFENGRSVNPNFSKIYYNLGNINYYELGNYGEAKKMYIRASEELSDEYYDLNYNLGWIHYKELDFENSNKYFIKTRELYKKDNPMINFALGNTYLQVGKYELASSEYLEIIDFYNERYGEYPKVNTGNKEMMEAMKVLSAVYNNLGVCKVSIYDEKKALVYFWKAVQYAKKMGFSNENPYARANIQYVLQGKHKVVSDPEMYNEIKKNLIDNPYDNIPF